MFEMCDFIIRATAMTCCFLSRYLGAMRRLSAICENMHEIKYNTRTKELMVIRLGKGPERVPPFLLRAHRFRYWSNFGNWFMYFLYYCDDSHLAICWHVCLRGARRMSKLLYLNLFVDNIITSICHTMSKRARI